MLRPGPDYSNTRKWQAFTCGLMALNVGPNIRNALALVMFGVVCNWSSNLLEVWRARALDDPWRCELGLGVLVKSFVVYLLASAGEAQQDGLCESIIRR